MIYNIKKTLLTSAAISALSLSTLNAGAILDFEIGLGTWNANPSGNINYGANIDVQDDLGLSKSNNTYLYADFNHFVPIVPNIRIEQQNLKMNASALSSFTWNGNSIVANNKTKLDLKQQDIVFYWNVPLLKTVTAGTLRVDFGVDIKKFDGSVIVNNENTSLDFTLPMGYLGATIDPPFIPASLWVSYKTVNYDKSKISDLMAKVSIDLPIPLPLLDIKLDIGYKEQSLKISKEISDNVSSDIKFDGMFFGISAKF